MHREKEVHTARALYYISNFKPQVKMSLGEETEGAALGRRLHQESPALNMQPIVLEAITGEALGEIVSTLVTGLDLGLLRIRHHAARTSAILPGSTWCDW